MHTASDFFIGNQTAFSATRMLDPFEYAVANCFDAFEWFPDKKASGGWDEQDLDKEARKKIKKTAEACQMRLSVHARWQADPVQPEGLELLCTDLELAKDLGARLVNLHLYTSKGLPAYVKALQPLVRRTAQAGIQLSIENSPENLPQDFNELFKVLRQERSNSTSHVGICFDMGHANLCAATRNDYLKYFLALDSSIPVIHLHMHENWGDYDSHLPLFTGPAGADGAGLEAFIRHLKKRHYTGSVIFEGWPQAPILLNHARAKLLHMIKTLAA